MVPIFKFRKIKCTRDTFPPKKPLVHKLTGLWLHEVLTLFSLFICDVIEIFLPELEGLSPEISYMEHTSVLKAQKGKLKD